jgi:hypothetical protein
VKQTFVGLSLFLVVAFVYYESPIHYLTDNAYSVLMDEAILVHGTPDMSSYQVEHGQQSPFINHGYLYTIDLVNGRLLYVYPWGCSLLSLPLVAFFDAFGLKVAPRGVYNVANETEIQAAAGAIFSAVVVAIFFGTSSLFLSRGWSLAIALGAAFGTSMWSAASRTMWPQTGYLVLISLVAWELAKMKPRPLLLGTLLAWACFARPQASPIVLVVSLYVLIEFGLPVFLKYAGAGAAWGSVFAATMLLFFGRLLAPSYSTMTGFSGLLPRAEGLLFSPSRGLLVFMPIVLWTLYLAARYWWCLPQKRLAFLALAVIAVHITMTACWGGWWGGWSYGPRLLMDTIPWFVLLTVVGVRAFLDDRQLTMQKCSAVIAAAMLLLAVSVAMNAPGALSSTANAWNATPNVDQYPDRVWDWQRPQFLAWVQAPLLGVVPPRRHHRASSDRWR